MHHISHEYIQNNPQLPFKLFSFHAHNLARVIPLHWHQSTEILYCESGELQVTVKNQSYLLKKNDFIVINPYEIHTSKSPIENHILCIQLPFFHTLQVILFTISLLFPQTRLSKNKIVMPN